MCRTINFNDDAVFNSDSITTDSVTEWTPTSGTENFELSGEALRGILYSQTQRFETELIGGSTSVDGSGGLFIPREFFHTKYNLNRKVLIL